MAESVGLSATLEFNAGAALSQMRKTTGAFAQMEAGMKKVKAGMAQVKKGFAGSTIVGAALSAGIVKSVKDFADFDFQMRKSISLTKDGQENQKTLTELAARMGAETFFTSKQAAEGIEVLARTGLKTTQIVSALPRVLQLSAAEGLDLARAAEIVTKTGNQFGVSMTEASRIADTFAFVSKNTATNVEDLAQGMTFVGTKAGRSMNISMEQTVGVLGLLANVAADSSVGGTTLNNALIKIGKNASNGAVRVGRFKATIVKTFDPATGKRGVDLVETMINISKASARIKDPIKRSAALTKLLGIRGEKAALAFSAAFGPKSRDETIKFLKQLQTNTKGAAKSLADAQINTVSGQFKIFQSATSAVSIAVGKMILKNTSLVPTMQRVAAVLGDASKAMSILSDPKMDPKAAREGLSKLSVKGVQVARGLREAFQGVKDVFGTVASAVKGVASIFNQDLGKATIQDMIRITAKTIAWAVALKGVGSVMGRLRDIAQGTFGIIKGGLSIALSGTAGIMGVLGKRVPLLASLGKKLPGAAGKLAGAMTGLEKLTAQPVRVVNFDESGLGGGIPGLGGKKGAPGAGAGQTGLLGSLGSLTKKAATAAGGIQNLAGRLAAQGGLVVAAAGAGVAIGTLIDKTFGLSSKISEELVAEKKRERSIKAGLLTAMADSTARRETLTQLKAISAKTKGTIGVGGKRVAVTRELATARLKALMSAQKLTAKEQTEQLKFYADKLAQFPTKDEFLAANKDFTLVNEIKLDGKVIARSVAVKKEEQQQRRGVKSRPGKKRERRVR